MEVGTRPFNIPEAMEVGAASIPGCNPGKSSPCHLNLGAVPNMPNGVVRKGLLNMAGWPIMAAETLIRDN
jgi:hypothetical protein